MVNNKKCDDCRHSGVCKFEDKLVFFDEENKKYIGIDITMETCKSYEAME